MTDDEWMVQQDRQHARASFSRMGRVWRTPKPRPAITPGRQLEIALAALAAQEAREGGTEKAA